MTEDFGPDAVKALWHSQQLDLPRLSPEFLCLRASDVRRTERAEAIEGYAAFIVMSAWVIWVLARAPAGSILTPAVGLPRLVVALLYLAAIYSVAWWHRLGGHRVFVRVSESSGLQTYIAELEQLRRSRRVSWNYSIYLPGYFVWIVSWWRYRIWPYSTAVFVFIATIFVVLYIWSLWYSRRRDKRVGHEIAVLRALQDDHAAVHH
jgi:hypothetical protein